MQTHKSHIMVLSTETRDYIQDDLLRSIFNQLEVLTAENLIEYEQGSKRPLQVIKKLHDEVGDIMTAMEKGNECDFVREHYDAVVWAIRSLYDARKYCMSVAS